MSFSIEGYALIGDCHTAALVNRSGSIDWLCLPRFDSGACFAALLGDAQNGRWRLSPAGPVWSVRRRYRPGTLILETEFECASGVVRVTDFMPVHETHSRVVRLVSGIAGHVPMHMDLVIRFDYGRRVPWVSRADDGSLNAAAGPHLLTLRTPVPHRGENLATAADFVIKAGQTLPFVVSYGSSFEERPRQIDPDEALKQTESRWADWSARCNYTGPWREAVIRSLITLKALTYAPTGAIVAAPTTSIPERRAGSRNWDYRYCWLRDATFTLLSLIIAGYREDADQWWRWLLRAVAGLPSQLQPVYSVMGDSRLHELELPWLAGYHGAKPVRIGNAAHSQLQLDVFGEVVDALHHARKIGLRPSHASWGLERALIDHLTTLMGVPDHGIWELRGPAQHLTHSKVMVWVALDRAVRTVEDFGWPGDAKRWRMLRDELHQEICEKGFDRELGAFVQAYGSKELDASCLLIPLVGFLPATDPRAASTIEAIRRKLSVDGLLYRYDTRSTGLPAREGAFLVCSFWLADNLILQGRKEEAERIFERLLGLRNDVGLLAEEYDVEHAELTGNFPQALSHLALIGTAYNLRDHRGPGHQRGRSSDPRYGA